jgi:hypothetical protein
MMFFRSMALRAGLSLCALLFLFVGAAQAERLPAAHEAAIHLKVLGYDRALPRRAGGRVHIVVLFDPSSSLSTAARDEMVGAFQAVARRTRIQNLPVSVSSLSHSAEQLEEQLSRATVAYVTPGLESQLGALLAIGARRNLPILSGDRRLAERGAPVAAYRKGRTAGLTINLRAARSAGMDLDSRLFAIAEVLR